MDDPVEAIELGAGWVRRLWAEAYQSLRDFPVWIGLGAALTVAMLLTIPLAPSGIAALTCAMPMMLGMLSWAARSDRTAKLPLGALIWLSAALLLIEVPVLLLLTEDGRTFIGRLVWMVSAVISTVVSPLGTYGILLAIPVFVGSAFGLGVCFAPHLIAARGLTMPQAIHRSLLAWGRNPVAFLVLAGLGVALVAFRFVALWIAAFTLLPLPVGATVLGNMLWAAAVLFYAAALVGFGRRVFGSSASTPRESTFMSDSRDRQ